MPKKRSLNTLLPTKVLPAMLLAGVVLATAACEPVTAIGDPGPGQNPDTVAGFPAPGQVPEGTKSIGKFTVYCYALSGKTASGEPVSTDVVAVDPKVIKLRTRLYIDGVGWRTALDTGGAIKGNKLDIWLPTVSECRKWGKRTAEVYVNAPS
jgi:3D (Asp-Asp-Asp) domain-containing protein